MINYLKSRMPEKTEAIKAFWFLLIYSNIFSFLAFAKKINSLIILYNIWDVLGIFAYVLMYAVIEAVFVLFLLLIWNIILPGALFHNDFTKWAIIWFIGITIFLYPFIVPISTSGLDEFKTPLIDSQKFNIFLPTWALFTLLIMGILRWFLSKQWISKKFDSLLEHISFLAKFYLIFDLLGIIVVTLRNAISLI